MTAFFSSSKSLGSGQPNSGYNKGGLTAVVGDVGHGEVAAVNPVIPHDLARPPVGIFLVNNSYNLSTFKLQLLFVLRCEIVVGDHFGLE